MRLRVVTAAAIALVVLLGANPALGSNWLSDPTGQTEEPARFVVGLDEPPTEDLLDRLLKAGAVTVHPLTSIDAVVVLGPESLIQKAATFPSVSYVERDGRVSLHNYQSDEQAGESAVREGASPLPQGFTGQGVTIAVMDSGIDRNHPDLDEAVIEAFHFDALWATEGVLDESTRDLLVSTLPSTGPVTTHGLSVGGIIAGSGDAAMGVDMRGVAPGAKLIDYNVCCSGIVTTQVLQAEPGWGSDFLLAYDHLLRHQHGPQYPGGVRVTVNAWGFMPGEPYPEEALTSIFREAIARGITLVFSAGNYGPDEGTVDAPQNLMEELVTVGVSCPAIDGFDHWADPPECGLGDLAVYSSRGPTVDLVAPAAGIWTPKTLVHTVGNQEFTEPRPGFDQDPEATLNNRLWYGVFGGTSAAAPYVAGVVALMLEADPTLTPAEIEAILKATAEDFGQDLPDTGWGHGEVRAFEAVVATLAS